MNSQPPEHDIEGYIILYYTGIHVHTRININKEEQEIPSEATFMLSTSLLLGKSAVSAILTH